MRIDNRRLRFAAVGAGAVAIEAAALRLRTGRFAGNVAVRCREGHVFTTIWIPGASLKALRLGPWRVQHCPVTSHWSLVRPVRPSQLSEEQRRGAAEHHDLRIP